MTNWLVILLIALALLLIAAVVGDRNRRRRGTGARATTVLMTASRLNRTDRRILGRMARAAALPNAGCLLLSRGCFEYAARRAAARGTDGEGIADLRQRVHHDN